MKKRQLGPCVTFFPQPATLVTTSDHQGNNNLMMASWAGIVSKSPPTMAVSLNKQRKTCANIQDTGVFGVNVVPSALAVEADACGLASGHDQDKVQLSGLHLSRGVLDKPLLIDESPLSVECRVSREVDLGDYWLVLGEIAEVHACDDAFDEEDRADITSFDPLVYLGGLREYWSLGHKEADAYKAGLDLLNNDRGNG